VIADLRKLISKQPFLTFTIHTVDGGAMRNRVFVFFDDGRRDDIRPLMISRITVDQRNGEPNC
jgi:hypothetical protein